MDWLASNSQKKTQRGRRKAHSMRTSEIHSVSIRNISHPASARRSTEIRFGETLWRVFCAIRNSGNRKTSATDAQLSVSHQPNVCQHGIRFVEAVQAAHNDLSLRPMRAPMNRNLFRRVNSTRTGNSVREQRVLAEISPFQGSGCFYTSLI